MKSQDGRRAILTRTLASRFLDIALARYRGACNPGPAGVYAKCNHSRLDGNPVTDCGHIMRHHHQDVGRCLSDRNQRVARDNL